jgi:hypothetical protein
MQLVLASLRRWKESKKVPFLPMTRIIDKTPFILLLLVPMLLATSVGQQNTLSTILAENRYGLQVENGRLSGTAVPVLQQAIAESQFVLLGEDHGTAEIPRLFSGICGLVAGNGFHTVAAEIGPLAAEQLRRWMSGPDSRARIAAFEKDYPASLAFYNMQQESEALTHCAEAMHLRDFQLWGLDQELYGSAGYILTRILETNLDENAAAFAGKLLEKSRQAAAQARKSGDVKDLFLISASDGDLQHLRELLDREGNQQSRKLLEELVRSREIYRKFLNGSPYASNRERAILLKKNFSGDFHDAARREGTPPKILVKFGAAHLYKGFNIFHNNDLGNFITETADSMGTKSLHILVLGQKGTKLHPARFGQPYTTDSFDLIQDKDSHFQFLKYFVNDSLPAAWTMFDLRPLRSRLALIQPVDNDFERTIFGYDFLVLIPEVTPSSKIQ